MAESNLQYAILAAQTILFVVQVVFSGNINSVALKALSYHTAVEGIQTAGRMITNELKNKAPTPTYSFGFLRVGIILEFSGMAITTMMCAAVLFEAILRMNYTSVFSDLVANSHEMISSRPKTNVVAITVTIFAFLDAIMIIFVRRLLRPAERIHAHAPSSSYLPLVIFGAEIRVHFSLLAVTFACLCSWLVSWTGYGALDAVGAIGATALLAPILLGLARRTGPILLQCAPAGPRAAFDRGCREVIRATAIPHPPTQPTNHPPPVTISFQWQGSVLCCE
jgi:divalent metal cation (Fe/Co/Zn/Cd) transporter